MNKMSRILIYKYKFINTTYVFKWIKFGFINTKTELSKKHTKNSNDVYCSLMKDEGNTRIREFEENAYLTENNYINCGKGTNELLKAS